MKFILEISFENGSDEAEFEALMNAGLDGDLLLSLSYPVTEFIYSQLGGVEHIVKLYIP
jgi:hypothetical protein